MVYTSVPKSTCRSGSTLFPYAVVFLRTVTTFKCVILVEITH